MEALSEPDSLPTGIRRTFSYPSDYTVVESHWKEDRLVKRDSTVYAQNGRLKFSRSNDYENKQWKQSKYAPLNEVTWQEIYSRTTLYNSTGPAIDTFLIRYYTNLNVTLTED